MPVKNCCIITKCSAQSTWKRVGKWKVIIMGGDGPHGSCGKKALNHQIFIIDYLRFVERAPACSAMFMWVWCFNSGRKLHRQLPIHLKNGSLKPSGSLQ